MISFELIKKDKGARRGRIITPHGVVETPVFMPVGTSASVKSLTADQIKATGSQIILSNTYHLYLRPGVEVLNQFRGVHNFMNWHGPMLTDSGGFQVLSLSNGLVKMTEEGVEFTSHLDGSKHFFTPERSMQVQRAIGADIIMAFDEPVKDSASWEYTKTSLEKTLRWLDRCKAEWMRLDSDHSQSLFGIVQGGIYQDLRIESAKQTIDRDLPGIAIGGETIGYNKEGTKEILDYLSPLLPEHIPHYTMGVGDIDDLFEVVERGIDMFDCVSPTRLARNAALLISPFEGGNKENKYRLNISRSIYAKDERPIDATCTCETCQQYSRGYLHHLFRSKELLANTLASIHNVHMLAYVSDLIRKAIEEERFAELKKEWVGQ